MTTKELFIYTTIAMFIFIVLLIFNNYINKKLDYDYKINTLENCQDYLKESTK